MKSYKIVVTGPFSAGKTAFIRSASDIEIVTTERRISDPAIVNSVKNETTVAMDYGQKRLEDAVLHLYGTPGQARFEFMWKILAHEMDAFVIVIDSSDKASLMDAKQIIRLFLRQARVPYLVAANKQDKEGVLNPKDIGKLLSLPEDVPVTPCVATNTTSVLGVLQQVYQLIA